MSHPNEAAAIFWLIYAIFAACWIYGAEQQTESEQ